MLSKHSLLVHVASTLNTNYTRHTTPQTQHTPQHLAADSTRRAARGRAADRTFRVARRVVGGADAFGCH